MWAFPGLNKRSCCSVTAPLHWELCWLKKGGEVKGLLFIDYSSAANALSTSLKIRYTLKDRGMQREKVRIL